MPKEQNKSGNMEADKKLSIIDQMAQIPKFSGSNPYYSINSFKKDFDEWADYFSWEEKDKFFILKKKLEGKAHEIFEIQEDNLKTSQDIFKTLNDRLNTSISPNDKLKNLWDFKQSPEMPVSDFVSLARKKAIAAASAHTCTKDQVNEAAEEWLLQTLCNNVLPQYRREILRRNPKTSQEFEQIALLEEKTWNSTNEISNPVGVVCNALPQQEDKMLKMLVEMESKIKDLSIKLENFEKPKIQRNKTDFTCYICGIRGHVAKHCRKNPQNQNYFNSRGRGNYPNNYRGAHNFMGSHFGPHNFQGNPFRDHNNFIQQYPQNFTVPENNATFSQGNNNGGGGIPRGQNNNRGSYVPRGNNTRENLRGRGNPLN